MNEFLWYLASPYTYKSDDPERVKRVLELRFRQVSADAADLIRAGLRVFVPISHTHPIAEHGGIDHGDHTIWLPADKPIHERCDGIIVDMIPGWNTSDGIAQELEWSAQHGKIIAYHRPYRLLPELVQIAQEDKRLMEEAASG